MYKNICELPHQNIPCDNFLEIFLAVFARPMRDVSMGNGIFLPRSFLSHIMEKVLVILAT